jgi:hypothetical protein
VSRVAPAGGPQAAALRSRQGPGLAVPVAGLSGARSLAGLTPSATRAAVANLRELVVVALDSRYWL